MVMKSTDTWISATNLWLRGAAFLDVNNGGMHRARAAGSSQEGRPLVLHQVWSDADTWSATIELASCVVQFNGTYYVGETLVNDCDHKIHTEQQELQQKWNENNQKVKSILWPSVQIHLEKCLYG